MFGNDLSTAPYPLVITPFPSPHHFFRRIHEVALHELHAELPQHSHGVRVLDALGDGGGAGLLGLLDQALDLFLAAPMDGLR